MAGSVNDLSYVESEQFALNFPLVMQAIADYMKTEYNEGRLKDVNYATVQAQAIQSAIQACLTLTMQTDSQQSQVKQQDAQTTMIVAQTSMVVAQTAEVAPNAAKQRAVQDSQIGQVNAERDYSLAKSDIAKNSRIDNLLIEAEKAQMQQLSVVGSGGLVPSTNDFVAGNNTRQSVYDRAVAGAAALGQTLPAISFSAGTTYTKAV
jgi:hypothetical protein